MVNYRRALNIDLPPGQSAFLWGARKTGKSTYLKSRFRDSLYYDLLDTDLFFRISKKPSILREEILASGEKLLKKPVIIDEVQRIPDLLNEVQLLIENYGLQFVLCGSSARKLKKGSANLLGGRAWRYIMHPLTFAEIPDFDILKAFNNGMLPSHYLSSNYKKSLKAYVLDYLNEEIRAEGLTRNLPAFARFVDAAAFTNGELLVYSNVASDCGVDNKTVKEYFQILEDTNIGYLVYPFAKSKKRKDIVSAPKFYYFDTGVVNLLAGNRIEQLKGQAAGKTFEHFILMELFAFNDYFEKDFRISYWRTKTGLEVDFVIGNYDTTIDVNISDNIKAGDLKGIKSFTEEYKTRKNIIVCNIPQSRKISLAGNISVELIPWKVFLTKLWEDKIWR
ncbi:MAG: ATP-binding protein [Oligoflexia bacterium]|nr:ATP-binding protein [Oligoflexia bacterium]